MSLPVFIHPDLSAARTGEAFSFSGPEARHAVTVKRMGEGESLELVDGTGIRLTLTITATSGKDSLEGTVDSIAVSYTHLRAHAARNRGAGHPEVRTRRARRGSRHPSRRR